MLFTPIIQHGIVTLKVFPQVVNTRCEFLNSGILKFTTKMRFGLGNRSSHYEGFVALVEIQVNNFSDELCNRFLQVPNPLCSNLASVSGK